jgi:uncharacterized protein
MNREIEVLLTLQERDQRLSALRAEMDRLPAERAQRERQLAESAGRLEAAKGRLKEIEVERKNLEVEAGVKRQGIDRYKTQQMQTRKNEEYAALQHEIDAAEKAIVVIEDREIELMEEAESLQPAIREAETAHAEDAAKIRTALEAIGARGPNIQSRIDELESARKEIAAKVDEDLLERYARLFASKAGRAVVELDGDVCMGCHMRVTHQTVLEVKSAKAITTCSNCGRILTLPA